MEKEAAFRCAVVTKKHYLILDGLRGIAALGVVIFHFMEWVFSDFSKNFIAHGFLAVDFFFCLSGFVIAYAYDDRIDKIGFSGFFKSRLIRLHPLVILGSVLGLITFLLDPYSNTAESYGALEIFLLFISSLLLIPAPMMEERAFNLLSLNAPAWSLFWEYVANIVYAFVLYKIGRRTLVMLTVFAAITVSFVAYDTGNLLGGWARDNFWDGGARVAYSFLAGMIIFRYKLIIPNNLGFLVIAVLLFMAFLLPWRDFNWISELLIVLIYFPFVVSLGAGSSLAAGLRKLCEFSGDISYPLYMTHYCAIWIFGNYYLKVKPSMEEVYSVIVVGIIFLVAFAYLVMRFFDIPLRRYLNGKRRRSSNI